MPVNNQPEFTQEEINAELARRGVLGGQVSQPAVQPTATPEFTQQQIAEELARRQAATQPEEQQPTDLLTRMGITSPLARFGIGVAASPIEMVRGGMGLLNLLGKVIAPPDPAVEELKQKIKEKLGLPTYKIPEIPQIGSGTAYTLGTILSPTPGGIGRIGVGAIKGGIKAAAKLGGKLMAKSVEVAPEMSAKDLMTHLTEGKQPEEIAQNILGDLRSAYDKRMGESSEYFDPIKEAIGDNDIYEPFEGVGNYHRMVDENLYKNFPKVKKLHDKFLDNPTYINARELESEMGKATAQITSGQVGLPENALLTRLREVKSGLRSDINDYLEATDPKLADLYKGGLQHYATYVAPYKDIRKVSQLVTREGKLGEKAKIEPNTLANIFKVPLTAKDVGEEELATNIQKVVNDMGEPSKKDILGLKFSQLKQRTPEKILETEADLGNQGYGFYKTPEFNTRIESLADLLRKREISSAQEKTLKALLKKGAYIGGGYYLLERLFGHSRSPFEGGD